MAVEKVKQLDETRAKQLLIWLNTMEQEEGFPQQPAGAMAMLGYARRFGSEPRTTAQWMAELRAGESEQWVGRRHLSADRHC